MPLAPEKPSHFQQLIEALLAEHDQQVQLLKNENQELQDRLALLDSAGGKCENIAEEPSDEHPLRQEAGFDLPAPPPNHPPVPPIEMPQGGNEEDGTEAPSGHSVRSVEKVQLVPTPLDSEVEESKSKLQIGTNRDPVQVVRITAYSVQLPGSVFPGDLDPAGAKVVVTVKCGELAGDIPATAALTQAGPREHGLPNQIINDIAWTAAWKEHGGGEVLIQVPKSMLESAGAILFDVQTAETAIPIGTGTMKLDSKRQQWMLDCGGFLEGQVQIEQANAGARGSRASITTRERIIERLEKLFDVKDKGAKVVMPSDLGLAMHNATQLNNKNTKSRSTKFETRLAPEDLEDVVLEMKRILQKDPDTPSRRKSVQVQPVLSWASFLECMLTSDLPKCSTGQAALYLFIVQRELLGDEMPATGTSQALLMAYEKAKKPISRSQRGVKIVTALSTAAIILSFAFMGISLDTDPNWSGWVVLDSICAVIFVAEVVVKTIVLTPREYFLGHDCVWNLFDVCLSAVAVTEIFLSLLFAGAGAQTRAALALRGLRLARMARLAKLMRMPLLEELANLISGFVLSVRSLFWVMIFLWLIVYVIALGFRAGVQTVSQSTTDRCGFGDDYPLKLSRDGEEDPMTEGPGPRLPTDCLLHYMYGVEFCGTVFGCMFSIFRCMISDCTTKGGRSLTMIFSDGFGTRFDMFYAAAMVVVLFGLFNIITAIFVEATLNGLKENEVQRKYAKAYESNYMTEQLAKLVMTVSAQVQKLRSRTALTGLFSDMSGTLQLGLSSTNASGLENGEIYLSEEEFNQLVRQPDVRTILNDLDVSVEPRPGIFDAFSTESDGSVSLSELVSGLMRMRGDLHKVDLVIAQMSLDNMQKQIKELKKLQEANKEVNKKA